jgi:hypothetical protein
MDSNVVRDVKRLQSDTNRLVTKLEEPAARYNNNIEVMDVHPIHYLTKRDETGNNVDIYLARRTKSNKDGDASKSDTSSSSSDTSTSDTSTSDSTSSSSTGSDSSGGDDCAASPTVKHCQQNEEADIQLLQSCNEVKQDSDNRRLQHDPANDVTIQEEQHDSRVHALELEAYMSLMKAFHATGSLNWAKETLLTDLRLHLHVSNEEHLQIICRFNGKPAGKPRNGHS